MTAVSDRQATNALSRVNCKGRSLRKELLIACDRSVEGEGVNEGHSHT